MALDFFGRTHLTVLEAAEQLGVALAALGQYAEADRLLAENLRIAVSTLGEAHPQTRGAREALATVDHHLGRFALATARQDSVVAAKAEARGGDHPGVVYSLVNAGDAWLDRAGAAWEERAGSTGAFASPPAPVAALDTAEARYRASLEMGARLGDNEEVYGMLARHGLARAAIRRGEVARADSLLSVAIGIGAEELRPDHRYLLDLERTRARILLLRGRPDRARRALELVLAAERAHRPSPHPHIGRTLALLADALEAEGDDGAPPPAVGPRPGRSSRGCPPTIRTGGPSPSTVPPVRPLRQACRTMHEPSGRGSTPLHMSPTKSVGTLAPTTPVPGTHRP